MILFPNSVCLIKTFGLFSLILEKHISVLFSAPEVMEVEAKKGESTLALSPYAVANYLRAALELSYKERCPWSKLNRQGIGFLLWEVSRDGTSLGSLITILLHYNQLKSLTCV